MLVPPDVQVHEVTSVTITRSFNVEGGMPYSCVSVHVHTRDGHALNLDLFALDPTDPLPFTEEDDSEAMPAPLPRLHLVDTSEVSASADRMARLAAELGADTIADAESGVVLHRDAFGRGYFREEDMLR